MHKEGKTKRRRKMKETGGEGGDNGSASGDLAGQVEETFVVSVFLFFLHDTC